MKRLIPVAAESTMDAVPDTSSLKGKTATGSSRRAFLGQVGGATAATIASAAVAAGPLRRPPQRSRQRSTRLCRPILAAASRLARAQ